MVRRRSTRIAAPLRHDFKVPLSGDSVVYKGKISWPTRGPNVGRRIGSTMRSRVAVRAKMPANDPVPRRSSSHVVVPGSACHAGGRGVRVPSLPLICLPCNTASCVASMGSHGASAGSIVSGRLDGKALQNAHIDGMCVPLRASEPGTVSARQHDLRRGRATSVGRRLHGEGSTADQARVNPKKRDETDGLATAPSSTRGVACGDALVGNNSTIRFPRFQRERGVRCGR